MQIVLSWRVRWLRQSGQGLVLIIAKLDHLARNVVFIANLLESGVEVMAADVAEAKRFVLHIMAAVAGQEAQTISNVLTLDRGRLADVRG